MKAPSFLAVSLMLYGCAIALSSPFLLSAKAETIRNAGILGNSGESGAALVRFGPKSASGIGVVYDRFGSLWAKGGSNTLNRYSPDGRLLSTFPLPEAKTSQDGIVLIGDTLLLKLDTRLYTLPITAKPGSEPTPLPVEATHLSTGTYGGWAAAAKDSEVFLVNITGETRPVATIKGRLFEVETGPDGGVYARTYHENINGVVRLDVPESKPSTAPLPSKSEQSHTHGPWPYFGARIQWMEGEAGAPGHWYGFDGYGTIRRFSRDFKPDPGVALGGSSGAFIGYVPGNFELNQGRGLARLGGNLYAIAGSTGVIHLLEWSPANKQFQIIRRIGAVLQCRALGINSSGRIYYFGGVWDWSDNPDAPLQHGANMSEGNLAPACVSLGGEQLAAPVRSGSGSWINITKLNDRADRINISDLPQDTVAAGHVTWGNRPALLTVNSSGKGVVFPLDDKEGVAAKIGDAQLIVSNGTAPLRQITALATSPGGNGNLLASADGAIIEFERDAKGKSWKEVRRWNSWGDGPDNQFGPEIHIATSKNRLWVSDTQKHRILTFTLQEPSPGATSAVSETMRRNSPPTAVFGTPNKPGDTRQSVNAPRVIAASGNRAVVFDSGNQRLVKLEVR